MSAIKEDAAQQLAFEAGRVFSPSAPIDERALFAGRTEQVRCVIDAINQKGQHAIIFGERGVGKTSLANVLASFFTPASPSAVLCPRVNCDTADTFESVWRKIFTEVQLAQQAVVGGFAVPSQQPREDAFDETLTPEVVRRQLTVWSKGRLSILILDEFDRLDDSAKSMFADTIKTLSDHAVAATVILVGVADSVDELIQEHQSIERALVQIKMPRMSKQEIFDVIQNGLKRLEMTIDADALERIYVLSQGLPHYAHLLGLHSCRVALDKHDSNITDLVLEAAISKAIDGAQQSVRSAWHAATISARKDNLFADVLLSCALAKVDDLSSFAAQDVRFPMQLITGKPYDIPTFAQHLNEFSDQKRGNILLKLGATRRFRYRFSNPLMQPFVILKGFADEKLNPKIFKQLEKHQS
jgi:Cdc6-like AAA superfamily ATPase